MYSNTAVVRVLSTAMALTIALSGCVKQRDDMKQQGLEDNAKAQFESPTFTTSRLWSLAEQVDTYKKVSPFSIRAGKILKKAQNTEAETSNIETDASLKYLDIVNFSTEHPLLAGKATIAEMLGEENATYGIVEELTPTHLVLSKLVTDDQISFVEKSYSTRQGNNWIVPIGGFAVTYLKEQKLVNEDNRATNVIARLPIPSSEYKSATHYEVNKNAFIRFSRIAKTDVLPKTFFEGEWYFTETTVDARFDRGSIVGDLGGSDSNFLSATRIKFEIFNTQLVGLNTNVDDEFKNDPNSINYNTVVKIPITHVDYRRDLIGQDVLKEQEETELKQESRRFIKLEYLKAETPTFSDSSELSPERILVMLLSIFTNNNVSDYKNLLDITLGKNYISFSIRDAQSGKILRFAMRKIDPSHKMAARRAFKEDNRIFGTFTTTKSKKIDYKTPRQEDRDNLILMARFNPAKDIVYYFTDKTPKMEWHRNLAREAISLWQQAFKKAGLKINIRLDESKDVALGDIRYNVINIVPRAGAGLLGYGPSLIDSETGEIVSASMNSGVDGFLEQYYHLVREYLSRKSGYAYNFRDENGDTKLPSLFNVIGKVNSGMVYANSETGELMLDGKTHLDPDSFNDVEKFVLSSVELAPNATIREFSEKVQSLHVNAYKHANLPSVFAYKTLAEEAFSSTMVLDNVIEQNCPAVKALAEKMKTTLVTTEEEIPVLDPCVKFIAQGDAVSTVVHELGHNLSLRHNFKGSVDVKNYPKIEDYQLKYITLAKGLARPMTSSVMEYASVEGQQVMPGSYDLAAIRWIYNGEVQAADDSFVKVDTTKPLVASVGEKSLKRYLFCTDEQRILITDPMCEMHDKGITVKDTVRFSIEQTYNSLARMYRYDRLSPSQVANNVFGAGKSLKAKYDKWRGFLRKYTGANKSYLQGYNNRSYEALIKSIEARGGAEAQALKEHLEVRNMIVKFFVDLAFISNKYCVVVDSANEERLIELEKIRKELFGIEDFSVISSCQSPSAAKYITDSGFKFVREFGHFLDAGLFDQDPSKIALEPIDFSGTASVRSISMALLTMRFSPSINNVVGDFAPSMIDEPDIRSYIQFLILDRLVNGVRVAEKNSRSDYAIPKLDLFGRAEIESIQKQTAYTNFNNEALLIQSFTQTLKENLFMPGSPDDGRRANVRVSAASAQDIESVKPIAADYMEYLGTIFYVRDTSTFGGKVMGRFKILTQQKQNLGVTPETIVKQKALVLDTLKKAGISFKTAAPTLKDLTYSMLTLSSVFQKLSEDPNNQPVLFALYNLFETEMTLFNNINQQFVAQGTSLEQMMMISNSEKPEEKEQKDSAVQALSQPIMASYVEFQKVDKNIAPPTDAELSRRYFALIKGHTAMYTNFTKNAEELDSQIDLLQRVVQQLSN